MEFSWKIERLECYPIVGALEHVVRTIHWRVFAESPAGTTSAAYGSIELEGPFAAEDLPFKPFAELTEEEVITWAKARLDVASLEAGLTQEIQLKEKPKVVAPPLPWNVQEIYIEPETSEVPEVPEVTEPVLAEEVTEASL